MNSEVNRSILIPINMQIELYRQMEIMAVCPSIFVSKIMQSNKENVDRDLSIVTTRTLGPQTRAKFLHSLFASFLDSPQNSRRRTKRKVNGEAVL